MGPREVRASSVSSKSRSCTQEDSGTFALVDLTSHRETVSIVRSHQVSDPTRPADRYCPRCGSPGRPDAQFCGKCGTRTGAAGRKPDPAQVVEPRVTERPTEVRLDHTWEPRSAATSLRKVLLVCACLVAVGTIGGVGAFALGRQAPPASNGTTGVRPIGSSDNTPIGSPTTASAATPIAAPAAGGTSDEAAVLAAIDGHWEAIKNQQFEYAYTFLAPNLATNEAAWVSAHESGGIIDVTYDFAVESVTGDSATVDVIALQTRAQSDQTTSNPAGCLNWTGTYAMARQGNRWLITRAQITPAPC